jgi:hypothetical protein
MRNRVASRQLGQSSINPQRKVFHIFGNGFITPLMLRSANGEFYP